MKLNQLIFIFCLLFTTSCSSKMDSQKQHVVTGKITKTEKIHLCDVSVNNLETSKIPYNKKVLISHNQNSLFLSIIKNNDNLIYLQLKVVETIEDIYRTKNQTVAIPIILTNDYYQKIRFDYNYEIDYLKGKLIHINCPAIKD